MNEIQYLHKEIINCNKCITERQIRTPFIGLGNFNAKIMFICERPGYQTTIIHGITLAGNKSGDFFLQCLEHINLSVNEIYMTNAVKCQEKDNRKPVDNEIRACNVFLKQELEIIKPALVVLMGRIAVSCFLPYVKSVIKQAGMTYVHNNQKYLVLPHPAWALRTNNEEQYKRWFEAVV